MSTPRKYSTNLILSKSGLLFLLCALLALASSSALAARKTQVSVSISPSSVSLTTGATQQFTATVSGTSNTSVTWLVNGVVGGNSTTGTVSGSGLYTAPSTAPSGSVTVTAQSVANTAKSASASITITAATAPATVSLTVTPTSASLNTGATQQFSASVSGSTNTGVSWLVNGVVGGNSTTGTVSTSGLYSAPSTVPSGGSVTVTAQSQADSTKSASAAVAISSSTSTSSSSTYALSVSTQSNHSGAIALNGATLSGNAYVYTSLASNLANYDPSGITQVCFWLDNTALSGTATHCESVMPYDFAGSADNTTTSLANAWNTANVANGSHTITQQVTLSAGGTEVDTATFTVNNSTVTPALSITTASLPGGTVNTAYSTTLSATGGTSPYTWSLASGSLPSGFSLASTGTISGTTTASGSFAFTAQVADSAGHTATANETLTVSTATSNSGSSPFFAATSYINTTLPSNISVDPNSASMVANSIGSQASAAHLSNDSYGVGLVYSKSTDKVYSVACTTYDSATCLVGSSINFPIPAGAVVPSGTDHNTAFIYTAQDGSPYAGMELDCWVAQYNSTNDTWSCGTASLVHNTTGWGTCAEANITSYHCNGGYAAGVDFAAGPVRPEEIAAGAIPHALVVAISNPGTGIACPATHTDHSGTGIPEGGHFYLPSSYNIDAQSWPSWVKIVAHALQNYGAYVVDYGGSFEVKGFTDKNATLDNSITWSSVGVPDDVGGDLAQIPWGQMQVETIQWCN